MREIPLSQGLVALVDDEDYEELSALNWHLVRPNGRAYAQHDVWSGNARVHREYMHRFLLPDAEEVDHINGNGLDNRRSNLRPATRAQNCANMRRSKANTSGYKGVSWHKGGRKWHAQIRGDAKREHLGLFTDPADAAKAYDNAARRLHGEFARLNFPGPGEAAA